MISTPLALEQSDLLEHLHAESKRVFTRAWFGLADVRAAWTGGGLRQTAGAVERCRAVLGWATDPDQTGELPPRVAITRAVEGYGHSTDPKVRDPFALFASAPGRWLTSRASSSQPSDFSHTTQADGEELLRTVFPPLPTQEVNPDEPPLVTEAERPASRDAPDSRTCALRLALQGELCTALLDRIGRATGLKDPHRDHPRNLGSRFLSGHLAGQLAGMSDAEVSRMHDTVRSREINNAQKVRVAGLDDAVAAAAAAAPRSWDAAFDAIEAALEAQRARGAA